MATRDEVLGALTARYGRASRADKGCDGVRGGDGLSSQACGAASSRPRQRRSIKTAAEAPAL
jgi:hypothetical protein